MRGTNFDAAKQGDAQDYSVEEIQGIAEIMGVQAGSWVENLITKSEMADLTSAEIVVSGGRALKTGENFSSGRRKIHKPFDPLSLGVFASSPFLPSSSYVYEKLCSQSWG